MTMGMKKLQNNCSISLSERLSTGLSSRPSEKDITESELSLFDQSDLLQQIHEEDDFDTSARGHVSAPEFGRAKKEGGSSGHKDRFIGDLSKIQEHSEDEMGDETP